jgi:RHS repeat-associated protein
LTAALPALAPGYYYVLVQVDSLYELADPNRANNTLAATTGQINIGLPALTLGTSHADSFTAADQDHYYQITVPAGGSLNVSLQSSASSGAVALYVSQGTLPTLYNYQQAAATANQTNQTAVVPQVLTSGTYYILAHSVSGAAATAGFTVTVTQTAAVTVSAISSYPGGNAGNVTVEIDGTNFTPAATASLTLDGTTINASSIDFVSASQIFATFNLAGAAVGNYALSVHQGSQSVTAPSTFHVVAASPASLNADLITPQFVRSGRTATIVITYANQTDNDMVAPLLAISSTNTNVSFSTPDDPNDYVQAAQVLAVAPSGPAGILRPGQSGQLTLTLLSDDTIDGDQIPVQVSQLENGQTIDWASLHASLQPSGIPTAAWNVIYGNMLATIGSTTDSYNAALAQAATYLSGLGETTAEVSDIGTIWTLLLSQADASFPTPTLISAVDASLSTPGNPSLAIDRTFMSSIDGRYTQGIFGLGWTTSWQTSLSVDGSGNVTIDSGGALGYFPIQANGTFLDTNGEYGSLTQSDGIYTFIDTSGNRYVFLASGLLNYEQDTNGNRITLGYNGQNEMVTLTYSNPSDASEPAEQLGLTYNAQGFVSKVADGTGDVWTYMYDGTGHLLSVTAPGPTPAGLTTSYTYDTGSNPETANALLSITNPDGSQENFTYDALGRLSTASANGGAEATTYTYAGEAEVEEADSADDQTIVWYNELGLPSRVQDPLGGISTYLYDNNGNLVSATDAAGDIYQYTYDQNGNLTKTINPLGQIVQMTYDSLSDLTSITDAGGNTTQYNYNSAGNLLSISYPDGTEQSFTYDPLGNLSETTLQNGDPVDYQYNAQGLVTQQTFADGTSQTFGYDAHGNLLTAQTYDSSGNLTGTTTLTYNGADDLTSIIYPGGLSLTFTYNAQGQRTQSVDQSGYTLTYSYDGLGRLDGLSDGSGMVVTYTYNNLGELQEKESGNGTYTTYAYDPAGDLTSEINHAPGGAVNSSFTYTYDVLGETTSMTDAAGNVTTYGYDALGQLTQVRLPGGQSITYVYNAAGDRTEVINNGTATNDASNADNEITQIGSTTYTYDANGNLRTVTDSSGTTTYNYNDQNELVSITASDGTVTTFQYSPIGFMTGMNVNGAQTSYLVDPTGLGSVVAAYNGTGSLIAHYNYGLGLVSQTGPSGTGYYDFDGSGNTIGIAGASGTYVSKYSYLPFGETMTISATLPNPFTYVGQFGVMSTGSGLVYMRNRWYNPITAAFTQPDPTGILGGLNLYSYADGNPINYVDPTGTQTVPAIPNWAPKSLQWKEWETFWQQWHPQKTFREAKQNEPGQENGDVDPESPETQGEYWKWANAGKKGKTYKDHRRNAAREKGQRFFVGVAVVAVGVGVGIAVGPAAIAAAATEVAETAVALAARYVAEVVIAGLALLRARVALGETTTKKSNDPNALIGPAGYGTQSFIQPTGTLPYTIDFENDGSVATQDVIVTEQLDPNLDWSTFQLGSFGFGPVNVTIPADLTEYQKTISYQNSDGSSLNVQVALDFNVATGLLTVTFDSIDPLTGQAPTGVFDGFLYPESESPVDSDGYVQYTVQPNAGLTTGATINQQASIVFDINAPLATNTAANAIDASAPTSSVTAPANSPPNFTVSWTGQDDGGSGIASYDVYVSDNGGPFTLWQSDTSATSATYTGQVGHTYGFYSVATDNVGNVQPTPAAAQATVQIVLIPTSVYVAPGYAGDAPGTAVTWTDGSTHYVGTDAFGTIQAGINAVAADGTVNVASGTYTEQLTIEQSLSLVGAGAASTTIQAPASLSGNEIEIASGVTVTMSGLSLDGASSSTAVDVNGGDLSASSLAITGYKVGVSVEHAGAATVTNSTIIDSTTGILVGSGSSDTSTLTATNDSFAGDTVGVQSNQSSGSLTATMDWWSSSTGPTNTSNPSGTGAKVIGSVNFSPWLGDVNIVAPDNLVFLSTTGEAFVVTPNSGNTSLGVSLSGNPTGSIPGGGTLSFAGTGGTVTVNGESGPASTDVFTIKDTSVQFNAADGLSGTTINFRGTGITRDVDAEGTNNTCNIHGAGTGGPFNLAGDSGTNSFVFSGSSGLLGTIKGGGSSTLSYAAYGSGVSVNLGNGTNGTATGVSGKVTGITAIIGSNFKDTLNAGAVPNVALTGGLGTNSLSGTGTGDSVVESIASSYTLTNSKLTGTGTGAGFTDNLSGITVASLTGVSAVGNAFTVSGWTGSGSLSAGAGTNAVTASKSAGFTLTNTSLSSTHGMTLGLSGIATANLTDTGSGHTFTVTGWTGNGTLKGSTETLVDGVSSSVVLAKTSLAVTGLPTLTLSGFKTANLSDTAGGHTFTVSGWTGSGSLTDSASITDTVAARKSASFTLTNTSLSSTDGMALGLSGITTANLAATSSSKTFTVSGWTGSGSLTDTASGIVKAAKNAGFTLTNTSLSSTDGMTLGLSGITTANLTATATNGSPSRIVDASAFTGVTNLTAGGTVNAILFGGSANGSTLSATGSGHDVLIGGLGKDTLTDTGTGYNILIGGPGVDTIKGNGNDILISGTTSYGSNTPTNIAALDAILAEWSSTDLYSTRISKIMSGVGSGGTDALNSSTCQSDGVANTVSDGASATQNNWFIVNSKDKVTKKRNETETIV